jgi:hypothetical protein
MAVVEISRPRRSDAGQAESYGGRQATKLRLLGSEIARIRYVYSEWSSAVGNGSGWGPMAQRMAAEKPTASKRKAKCETCCRRMHRPGCPKAWTESGNTMKCGADSVPIFDATQMSEIEIWCDRPRRDRDATIRCWRALRDLDAATPFHAVILCRLYGDVPPKGDTMARNLWTDPDYHKVAKYGARALGMDGVEALLPIDTAKRDGEKPAERDQRVRAAKAARTEAIKRLGQISEKLIVAASNAYRNAWDAVEP